MSESTKLVVSAFTKVYSKSAKSAFRNAFGITC